MSRDLRSLLASALKETERACTEIERLIDRTAATAPSGMVGQVQEHIREAEEAATEIVTAAATHLTGFNPADSATWSVLDDKIDALGFMGVPSFMPTLDKAQTEGATARAAMAEWLSSADQRAFNAEGYIVDRDVPMSELKPITDALRPLRDTLRTFKG